MTKGLLATTLRAASLASPAALAAAGSNRGALFHPIAGPVTVSSCRR